MLSVALQPGAAAAGGLESQFVPGDDGEGGSGGHGADVGVGGTQRRGFQLLSAATGSWRWSQSPS